MRVIFVVFLFGCARAHGGDRDVGEDAAADVGFDGSVPSIEGTGPSASFSQRFLFHGAARSGEGTAVVGFTDPDAVRREGVFAYFGSSRGLEWASRVTAPEEARLLSVATRGDEAAAVGAVGARAAVISADLAGVRSSIAWSGAEELLLVDIAMDESGWVAVGGVVDGDRQDVLVMVDGAPSAYRLALPDDSRGYSVALSPDRVFVVADFGVPGNFSMTIALERDPLTPIWAQRFERGAGDIRVDGDALHVAGGSRYHVLDASSGSVRASVAFVTLGLVQQSVRYDGELWFAGADHGGEPFVGRLLGDRLVGSQVSGVPRYHTLGTTPLVLDEFGGVYAAQRPLTPEVDLLPVDAEGRIGCGSTPLDIEVQDAELEGVVITATITPLTLTPSDLPLIDEPATRIEACAP